MEYLNMGMKYQIPEFLEMCNTIFEIVERQQITSPDFLIWFMLYPKYRSFAYEKSYQQPDFQRHYAQSGIYRAKQGKHTYTVMAGKSNFLYFHNGTIKLEMKVAGRFCEHRVFRAEHMTIEKQGTVHLRIRP